MRRESMHPRGFVLFLFFSLLGRVRGVGLFGFLGFPSWSHQVLTLFLIPVLKLFPKFSFCSPNMFPIAPHVSHMLRLMLSFWNIWTWANFMPYFCVCFEWMLVHWNLGDFQSFRKEKFPVLLLIKHAFVLNWTSPEKFNELPTNSWRTIPGFNRFLLWIFSKDFCWIQLGHMAIRACNVW
jgi:hypothetical protein